MLILAIAILAGGVRVELPMEARVHGSQLSLGAVAKIACDDAGVAARVAALRLGYAPAPGYSRLIQADWLAGELRGIAPDLRFEIVGERACRVFPNVERVASASIEQAARAELEKRLAGMDASVVLGDPIREVEVPAGSAPCALAARLDAREVRPGVVAVAVELAVDGETYKTVWTSWKVALYQARPVLRRAVKAGEAVASDAFELRRVALAPGDDPLPLEPRLLAGAAFARDLPEGAVLGTAHLMRPQVIQKGDTLQVSIKKGAITARVRAVARQGGAVGDHIQLTVGENERLLVAVVTARGAAEVELAAGS